MAPAALEPEPEIDCIECGGRCFLLSHAPPAGWEPDDVVAYRCGHCMERFDVVLPGDPGDPAGQPGG